jgi:DNA-binding transcriptional LysR family regulator
MDTSALKAFLVITETGSFSAAAVQLHLTQPAISKRILTLENRFGARLFDRIGRTVTLTEAGRELAPRARDILQRIEDSQRAIHNLAGHTTGRLSLATSHHVGLWRLPPLLQTYSKLHPDVVLDLHFMDSEVAHEMIAQGNLEIGIITMAPSRHERLESVPLWNDKLIFVVAADHPLASNNRLSLAELAEYPAILPDLTTFTGRIVQNLFHQQKLALHISMSTNYLETIKMLISIGLGWSVLPVTMLDDKCCALDVAEVQIKRELGYIYHVQRTISNAGAAFLELLESTKDIDARAG